ncbi:MAG: tRNA (adenosine(37)-N6)-threonylcarbamoyltransferase complex dimerization subunit type 1 TsaB [Candidatus Aminicenantes bacterium]|nr:tRNA (adenosine(37)-N6)-threonylcarbamoyltransferase complex dimerization subunit type 1 TsaB [Candidatus Aminicenantes bacterium]
MRILAVDTTTPSGSVALLDNERLLGEFCLESPATHSARLFRAIDALLEAAGLGVGQVDGFAVAAGPGSFTGIRIGLGAVKSLAFASGKPVAPVSTLLALAMKPVAEGARLVCPLLDAKKEEIYAALFERRRAGLEELIAQGVYSSDAFFARLPARRVITFIGGGLEAYREKLASHVRDKARISGRSPFIAAEVGRAGFRLIREGQGVSAAGLEPVYFRRSQAEEKSRA